MKTVLLIGDSIREFYQDRVRELLDGEARILTPSENARYTKYTLWGMWAWTEEWGHPQVDLIHWNNGIWDLHRATADGLAFTPLEEYVRENERLYTQMRSYTDRLIWATTIPGGPALDNNFAHAPLVRGEMPPRVKRTLALPQAMWNEEVRRYNDAARRMYESHGVVIDDLYAALSPDPAAFISEDGIHPSPAGVERLARQVAAVIRENLAD